MSYLTLEGTRLSIERSAGTHVMTNKMTEQEIAAVVTTAVAGLLKGPCRNPYMITLRAYPQE